MNGSTSVGFATTGEMETAVDLTFSSVEVAEAFGSDFSEEQATSGMGNNPIARIWSFTMRFSPPRASGPDIFIRRVVADPATQIPLGEVNWRPVFSGDYGVWQPLRPNQIVAVRRSKMQVESARQEDRST